MQFVGTVAAAAIVCVAVLSEAQSSADAATVSGPAVAATGDLRFETLAEFNAANGREVTQAPFAGDYASKVQIAAANDAVANRAATSTAAYFSPYGTTPGPTVNWWTVEHEATDVDGIYLPVRFGNGELGYAHYAIAHNLFAFQPIDVAYKESAEVVSGADRQYEALLVDTGTMEIYATIIVKSRASATTADGRYTTPGGRHIGVITAYCKGVDECPRSSTRERHTETARYRKVRE